MKDEGVAASDRPSEMLPVRFFLLGHFRIKGRAGPIILPTRSAKSALAYLILNPAPYSRDGVTTLLWHDPPVKNVCVLLRVALATIRARLGSGEFYNEHDTVQLQPDYPKWVDTLEFEAQAPRLLSGSANDPSAILA